MSETAALSSQEQALKEGKKVLHGTVTDRVLRMFEAMRAYGPPRVALERSILFTEAFKANENDPLIVKWAKALKHYAEKSTVAILDDELIVGRPNAWLGRWAIVYAELDGAIMPDGVKEFKKNKGKIGEVVVTPEDEKIILDVLTPYWTGRDYASNFHDAIPLDTRFLMYGPNPKCVAQNCAFLQPKFSRP
jgi:isethionate sulfite-lyase